MTEDKKKSKRRRGRGEGSIFQRDDGRWSATITVGRSETGKRLRKTVYGSTKGEVTTELTRLQNQKLDGSLIPTNRTTVAALIDRWLTSWADNLRANSAQRYRDVADKFINPILGGMEVGKLRPTHIRAMLDKMAEDGKGPRQRLYAFQTIRRALNLAMKLELVPRNVCRSVETPKMPRRAVEVLTPEQASAVVKVAEGTRWEALFTLALSTGLRQGELFALAWADVDFDRGILTVRHSLEELKGKLTIKEPKSESGRRPIRLDPADVEVLRQHRLRMAAEGQAFNEFIFVDCDGGFLRKSNFTRKVWYPIRETAGAGKIRFHDLRHSAASFMLRAGVHPKVAQHRLGHSTIKLTMDTYSHLLPDSQDDAAGAFHQARNGAKTEIGCQMAVKLPGTPKKNKAESA